MPETVGYDWIATLGPGFMTHLEGFGISEPGEVVVIDLAELVKQGVIEIPIADLQNFYRSLTEGNSEYIQKRSEPSKRRDIKRRRHAEHNKEINERGGRLGDEQSAVKAAYAAITKGQSIDHPVNRIEWHLDAGIEWKLNTSLELEPIVTTLLGKCWLEVVQIVTDMITLADCVNCPRPFIPGPKEIYCNRQAPGYLDKTCRDVGADKRHQEKVRQDPKKQSLRREEARFGMRKTRAKKQF